MAESVDEIRDKMRRRFPITRMSGPSPSPTRPPFLWGRFETVFKARNRE
jgi:hypothetical protein